MLNFRGVSFGVCIYGKQFPGVGWFNHRFSRKVLRSAAEEENSDEVDGKSPGKQYRLPVPIIFQGAVDFPGV